MNNSTKTILVSRYLRCKSGLAMHADLFPAEIQPFLRSDELITLGDEFVAHLERETGARPQLSPLREALAHAELELDTIYRRVKNLVEAEIGEKSPLMSEFILKNVDLITRAAELHAALANHSAIAEKISLADREKLDQEIEEYRLARKNLGDTTETATTADSATDTTADELVYRLARTKNYVESYLFEIHRLDLLPDFVILRAKTKTQHPVSPQHPVSEVLAALPDLAYRVSGGNIEINGTRTISSETVTGEFVVAAGELKPADFTAVAEGGFLSEAVNLAISAVRFEGGRLHFDLAIPNDSNWNGVSVAVSSLVEPRKVVARALVS